MLRVRSVTETVGVPRFLVVSVNTKSQSHALP